jgi:hypothetical protein
MFDFSDGIRVDVANYILEKADKGDEIFPSMLFDVLGEDATEELNSILTCGDEIFVGGRAEKYYGDCLSIIEDEALQKEIKELEKIYTLETDVENRKHIMTILQDKLMKSKNKKSNRNKTEDEK